MNKDTELFGLCREVYRLLEWDSNDLRHHLDGEVYARPLFESDVKADKNSYHPLYTSDYLLGKLPPSATVSKASKTYGAWIAGITDIEHAMENPTFNEADTPLKALLKLTIALHEAGELS